MTSRWEIRRTIFVPFFALSLIVEGVLTVTGNSIKTNAAPLGIISYELAGSIEEAHEILNSWSEPLKRIAAFNLGLDYLFIFAYTITISLACSWAGTVFKSHHSLFASFARPLIGGILLAGIFDAAENLALILMLFGKVVDPWPGIAAWAAIAKFALLAAGLIYILCGGIAWAIPRFPITRKSPQP